MSIHHAFLNPLCSSKTLDIFNVRRSILEAISTNLQRFHGILLDIGCGDMPYKPIFLTPPSQVQSYIGLDLRASIYQKPDIEWDGHSIPLRDKIIDCVLATEVFEHCPAPEQIMCEILRVLKPGGLLFFTVPFLWPLHTVPHDEYRYTPFALERLLRNAGFVQVQLKP